MNGGKRTGPIVAKEGASKLSEKRDFIAENCPPVEERASTEEPQRTGAASEPADRRRGSVPSTGPKGGFRSLRVVSSRRVSDADDILSTATATGGRPHRPFGADAGRMPTLPGKPRCGRGLCPRRERDHLGGARDGSTVPQGFRPGRCHLDSDNKERETPQPLSRQIPVFPLFQAELIPCPPCSAVRSPISRRAGAKSSWRLMSDSVACDRSSRQHTEMILPRREPAIASADPARLNEFRRVRSFEVRSDDLVDAGSGLGLRPSWPFPSSRWNLLPFSSADSNREERPSCRRESKARDERRRFT